MTEQDKVTVDDIIGIVKTEEQTNSVEEVRKLRGRENKTAKRFTLAYSNDLENDKWWAVRDGDITLWKEEVVECLNALHEENQSLRKDRDWQKGVYSDLLDKFIELKKKNQLLQKENEDLNEELMELDSFKKLAKEKGWIE